MSTQIHDLGYRAYVGERAGVPWAVRSLAVHSMRRALGLKRAGRHKIVPIITVVLSYLPAIVLVGTSVFIGLDASDLIGYGEYYGLIFWALSLFTAAAAPGVLTTDRTSGMLAMYLASPLTRTTYVLAKAIGVFIVLLSVTVGPIVFLVLAYTFAGHGPGGPLDFFETFIRALIAGTIAAAFYTGLGMFVSSIPKRWGIASVSIIAALLVPAGVVSILTEAADVTDWVSLASPAQVMAESWQRVFGDAQFDAAAIDNLGSFAVVGTAIAYGVVFLGASWWRYQKLDVDR